MSATSGKFLVGIFDDEDVLLHGIPDIRNSGVKILEVFSPFPLHGLDEALGYERSKLDIAAFFFGLTGTLTALTMISYMMFFDWPMMIGGKSNFPLPDFIPVTFELTVLFCAYGMTITFFIISNLLPGVKPILFDKRCTDHKFVMAIDLSKNKMSEEEITSILKENGASEVNQKEF